ncbi:hypothetical protein [Phytoactinopolyspora halotolerans]|uniref:Teneurin NHL domain-containing protein n=1 Tax=Phytoactinopolyspora halotolerans TaxID=1981512 RepID=A0A6L9SAF6_9ACTN|nr:hypothetical protein [Phytoactinopolyspora halotolerans]NEE01601.1 hypothetical protein [Phytoactinopolyspora halotolerans]
MSGADRQVRRSRRHTRSFPTPRAAAILVAALMLADAPAVARADTEPDAVIDVADMEPGQAVTIAGIGEPEDYLRDGGDSGDGGAAADAPLGRELRIEVAPDGTLYISDGWNESLRVVDTEGVIATMAGARTSAEMEHDRSVTPQVSIDDDGTIYVSNGSVVRRMDSDGGEAVTVAGGGDARMDDGRVNGRAVDATLRITDLAVRDGVLYVADRLGKEQWRIHTVDGDGSITTLAGGGDLGVQASEGGAATEAHLTRVSSIAVDSQGNVYVTEDRYDDLHSEARPYIRKIGADGSISTVLGGTEPGYTGDGGPARAARIGRAGPALAVDAEDRLLLVDSQNGVIRRIDGRGVISTVAPVWDAVTDIAVGADGSLYLAGQGRVVMMALNGLAVDPGMDDAEEAEAAADPWADEEQGTVLTVADLAPDELIGQPRGITVGVDGTIHVVGSRDDSVLAISAEGDTERIPTGVGGTYPFERVTTDVERGADGSVYVAVDRAVVRIYPDGSTAVVAGGGRVGDPADGQLAFTAMMRQGVRLASARDGTLYVGDFLSRRVYELERDGILRIVSDGPVGAQTGGLAAGPDGHIYVSGCVNRSVNLEELKHEHALVLDPDGNVEPLVEFRTPLSSLDVLDYCHPLQAAPVNSPSDIAVDDDGTAYVATSEGIQSVGPDGSAQTVVEPSDDAGVPSALALDVHGNLYFTESSSDRVRVVVRPGGDAGLERGVVMVAAGGFAFVGLIGAGVVLYRRRGRVRATG